MDPKASVLPTIPQRLQEHHRLTRRPRKLWSYRRLNTSAYQPTMTAARSPTIIVNRDPVSVKSYINVTSHVFLKRVDFGLLFKTNLTINFAFLLQFSLKCTMQAKRPSSF